MKPDTPCNPALPLLALTCALALAAAPALAREAPPPYTEEGLVLVEDSQWGLVYIDPEADFSTYDRVMMISTQVAFRKNWQRDQNRSASVNRVRQSDMDRIKADLAAEFDAVFREVLEEDDGYPVVDEPGENVLLLRPAIINLDVAAPDTNSVGRSRSYTDRAGEMTLYLEIYDAPTGALMAKGVDRQADRRSGFFTWQSKVQNRSAARRILRGWATSLREGLDAARAESALADEME